MSIWIRGTDRIPVERIIQNADITCQGLFSKSQHGFTLRHTNPLDTFFSGAELSGYCMIGAAAPFSITSFSIFHRIRRASHRILSFQFIQTVITSQNVFAGLIHCLCLIHPFYMDLAGFFPCALTSIFLKRCWHFGIAFSIRFFPTLLCALYPVSLWID